MVMQFVKPVGVNRTLYNVGAKVQNLNNKKNITENHYLSTYTHKNVVVGNSHNTPRPSWLTYTEIDSHPPQHVPPTLDHAHLQDGAIALAILLFSLGFATKLIASEMNFKELIQLIPLFRNENDLLNELESDIVKTCNSAKYLIEFKQIFTEDYKKIKSAFSDVSTLGIITNQKKLSELALIVNQYIIFLSHFRRICDTLTEIKQSNKISVSLKYGAFTNIDIHTSNILNNIREQIMGFMPFSANRTQRIINFEELLKYHNDILEVLERQLINLDRSFIQRDTDFAVITKDILAFKEKIADNQTKLTSEEYNKYKILIDEMSDINLDIFEKKFKCETTYIVQLKSYLSQSNNDNHLDEFKILREKYRVIQQALKEITRNLYNKSQKFGKEYNDFLKQIQD